MGYRPKQRILNRQISNGRKTPKKMFNIHRHQKNTNQNNSEISSYTRQNGQDKKTLMVVFAREDVR